MSNKDSLGDRIKQYEDVWRLKLPIRMPIILRLDGKSFSQLTAKHQKPIDPGIVECMNQTALSLCKEIQGTKLAYIQSDEISLLIYNSNIESQPWFDNNLQKMVSVSASTASVVFTDYYNSIFPNKKLAYFDSRAFILPKEEVNNAFYWRQIDCIRNSVQSFARANFSHKQCLNKSVVQLKEMLLEKDINWELLPNEQKIGRCVVKQINNKSAVNKKTGETSNVIRSEWIISNDIPNFHLNTLFINSKLE